MSAQPEALRLADQLERMSLSTPWDKAAAAELRRLHAANIDCVNHFDAVKAERDDLMDALQHIAIAEYRQWDAPLNNAKDFHDWAKSRARASIFKVTGVQL